jgi:hypothetical protein
MRATPRASFPAPRKQGPRERCSHAAAVLRAIAALLLAAPPANAGDAPAGGSIKHIVMCWLKEPGNAQHRERVAAVSRELVLIPEVLDMVVGAPVASERPVVEDTFDVGIVMTFQDETALATYLAHPEHVSRVQSTLSPLCGRVQVLDIRY